MKNIQKVELNKLAKEELLPAFSTDFPYIAICAGLAQAAASAKLSGKIRLYAIGIPQALAQS